MATSSLVGILQICSSRHAANVIHVCADGLDISIGDVPSVTDVTFIFANGKQGKGHGEDSPSAELFKIAAAFLAQCVRQLYTKAFLRLEEPLSFKGGSGALRGESEGSGAC